MEQNIEQNSVSFNNQLETFKQSQREISSQFVSTIIISYSYFIQGVILSVDSTIILTYDKIPQYSVLGIFAISSIPFSFKFILAPFLETFTSIQYGKRKTWLVLSCFAVSGTIFLMSYLTAQKYQIHFALTSFFLELFTALQDIALDALSIKQLKNPEKVSLIQATVQKMGLILGSLLMIKLTSQKFGKIIGYTGSICNIRQFLIWLSAIIFCMNLLIHFLFKQQTIQNERRLKQKNLKQNIVQYSIFFEYKSKYFRQAIMFILYYQGIKFFQSGYQIQLMRNGFSQQSVNQINNLGSVPIMILTFFFSKITSVQNVQYYFMYVSILKTLLCLIYFVIQFDTYFAVWIYVIINDLLNNFQVLIILTIINTYPISGLSGMFITMLLSSYNFGQIQAIHLFIIGAVGFRIATTIGFIIQFMIVYNFPKLINWINQGDLPTVNQIIQTEKDCLIKLQQQQV